jgi:hypothetical protein
MMGLLAPMIGLVFLLIYLANGPDSEPRPNERNWPLTPDVVGLFRLVVIEMVRLLDMTRETVHGEVVVEDVNVVRGVEVEEQKESEKEKEKESEKIEVVDVHASLLLINTS